MININHLAKLARLDLREEEKASLERELRSILNYVSEIKAITPTLVEGYSERVTLPMAEGNPRQENIFRDDADPYPPGDFTEAILAEAPREEEGYLVVKQIIAEK